MVDTVYSQQGMEESLKSFVQWVNLDYPDCIMAKLAPEFVSCDFAKKEVVLCFPVLEWMRSPGGVMHGGAVAAAIDTAMATQGYYWTGSRTPVVNLNCSFLHKVPVGSMLYVRARVLNAGRTTLYATAEAWVDGAPEQIVVSATGVYHISKKS